MLSHLLLLKPFFNVKKQKQNIKEKKQNIKEKNKIKDFITRV
jgi:hypothetical protein